MIKKDEAELYVLDSKWKIIQKEKSYETVNWLFL